MTKAVLLSVAYDAGDGGPCFAGSRRAVDCNGLIIRRGLFTGRRELRPDRRIELARRIDDPGAVGEERRHAGEPSTAFLVARRGRPAH